MYEAEFLKLVAARSRLLVSEPFYGVLCLPVQWICSTTLRMPTMGVTVTSEGIRCYWDPSFVASRTLEQLIGAIQHELEHLLRLHCTRGGDKKRGPWDLACCKPQELIVGGSDKQIADINNGDTVYGSNGCETAVVAPMQRLYCGKMVRLKGRFLLPFEVTPEHPILVSSWKIKTTTNPKTTIKVYSKPKFVKAGELRGCESTRQRGLVRSGYALVIPKYKQYDHTEHLDLSKYIRQPGHYSIRTESLHLDCDMAWLMGLYVAEGSACSADLSAGFQFTLSSNEIDLATEIKRILRQYGFAPNAKTTKSSMKVSVGSPILARAFADWFGRGAANKRIPAWLRHHADRNVVLAFLRGYFAGDGHNSEHSSKARQNIARNSARTVSRLLALQVQMMGFTHDIPFGLYESHNETRTINNVTLPPEVSYVLESGTWQARKLFGQANGRRRNWHHDAGDQVYVPLMEVSENAYDGPVHNIETVDHTYLVSNAVVHNCEMCVNGTSAHPRVGFNGVLPLEREQMMWIPADWTSNQSADFYYEKLLEEEHSFPPSIFVDDHGVWIEGNLSPDEARQIVVGWCEAAISRTQGSIPGHVADLLKQLHKPIINWQQILKQFVGRYLGGRRSTFNRRNRRLDDFGTKGFSHHACASLTVVVDTSGSISKDELEQFFSEIEATTYHVKVTVVLWDCTLQGVYDRYRKGDWKKIKVSGRGGTSMAQAVDWVSTSHLQGQACLLLTDGETDWPSKKPFPLLTCIVRDSTSEPDWGTVIRMKDK